MSWDLRHVTWQSPAADKDEALQFSSGDYLWASRERLAAPWGDETYGLVGAFDGGHCLGTTGYTISVRGQGILAQVFTDPEHRRQGIGRATLEETVATYRQHGARAVYLAAWKDWTRALYHSAGFRLVGTMGERHAFKLTLDPSGDDAQLFRPGQPTDLRDVGSGDHADLSALFNASPAPVKSYALGCFSGSHFEGEFYTIRRRDDVDAVVVDGQEMILGFGTVIPDTHRHQTHRGTLDAFVHPHYAERLADLLDTLHQRTPLESLIAYAAPDDEERCRNLESLGYVAIGRVTAALKIGAQTHDLMMYEKQLAG